MNRHIYAVLLILIALTGCQAGVNPGLQRAEDIVPLPGDKTIAMFAIGDSLTAGTQDAATFDETQKYSWPSQLAAQVHGKRDTRYSYPALGMDGSRKHPETLPTNVAIPGLGILEALEETGAIALIEGVPVEIQPYLAPYGTGASTPITPKDALVDALLAEEHAAMEHWVFVWIGANDAFFDVTKFDAITSAEIDANTPSPDRFTADYAALIDAIMDTKPDGLFVMTIPDMTKAGFLFTPEDLAFLLGSDAPMRVLNADDLVPLTTAVELYGSAVLGSSIDLLLGTLTASDIVDGSEQQLLRERINAYNVAIRATAAARGVAVIDIATQLNGWLANGVALAESRQLTRSWGRGGMFSLDGVHPSHTGQALIANAVIEEINALYEMDIPAIDIAATYRADPYRDMDGDGRVAGPAWKPVSGSPAALLRVFVDDDDDSPAN